MFRFFSCFELVLAKQLVTAVIITIGRYCCVLNIAQFDILKGATPDPLGGICTSPLKRVFQYVPFGQNKSASVSVPDHRQGGTL